MSVQSLKGQLLIAGPSLVDPNFRRTVVLVGEHNEEGALGLVLNRASEATVDEAVPELAVIVDSISHVHFGGPVQPSAIVVLADFVDPDRAGSLVLDSVGFLPAEVDPTSSASSAARASSRATPAGARASSTASSRKARGSSSPRSPEDVFTDDPEELWADVLRRKGGPFGVLAHMPYDPSLN